MLEKEADWCLDDEYLSIGLLKFCSGKLIYREFSQDTSIFILCIHLDLLVPNVQLCILKVLDPSANEVDVT